MMGEFKDERGQIAQGVRLSAEAAWLKQGQRFRASRRHARGIVRDGGYCADPVRVQ
jgi:hypothetical protein